MKRVVSGHSWAVTGHWGCDMPCDVSFVLHGSQSKVILSKYIIVTYSVQENETTYLVCLCYHINNHPVISGFIIYRLDRYTLPTPLMVCQKGLKYARSLWFSNCL